MEETAMEGDYSTTSPRSCPDASRYSGSFYECKLSGVNTIMYYGASILIIQRPWIDLILDGHKTLEIRGKPCNKSNERIYLALSGGGGVVIGSVTFAKCHGPLSRAEWAARGEQHRVAGDSVLPYGGSTYAWELVKPVRFKQPVVYKHKPGVVVWAKME